jgi:hypothetical protein
MAAMPDSSEVLRARVLAAASAARSPTRRQGRVLASVFLAASVAIAATIFEAIGGLGHGAGRPTTITVVLAAGWSLVSALLTWLIVARGGSVMVRRPLLVAALALAMPFVLFFWMHLFYGTYAEPFQAIGYRCLGYTLFISALPLGAFLLLRRAIEPRYPSALGAGAGAACASWAGALVDLWCPLTNPMHVLIGHVAPLVLATLVGAVLGHFMLGVRRSRSPLPPGRG